VPWIDLAAKKEMDSKAEISLVKADKMQEKNKKREHEIVPFFYMYKL
jgi:hypothetical protein